VDNALGKECALKRLNHIVNNAIGAIFLHKNAQELAVNGEKDFCSTWVQVGSIHATWLKCEQHLAYTIVHKGWELLDLGWYGLTAELIYYICFHFGVEVENKVFIIKHVADHYIYIYISRLTHQSQKRA
jgi:hypothetical protein